MIEDKITVVFPGQGAQSIGMMDALQAAFPAIMDLFDAAQQVLGYDLWKLIHRGPQAELDRTEKTQPALLVSGVAIWELLKTRIEVRPYYFAGHSLGEYTALVCSGVISFSDGVRLVAERGRCMQQAVPIGTGAMAVILGLEEHIIAQICKQLSSISQTVAIANFNSPSQFVIAGDIKAVEKAIEASKEEGAKRAFHLPISTPSHCSLMTTAAERFATHLDAVPFSDANTLLIQNVDATARKEAAMIKQQLLQQLYRPVQWIKTVQQMKKENVSLVIECGATVLCGLIKRIDRSLQALPIIDETSLEKAVLCSMR